MNDFLQQDDAARHEAEQAGDGGEDGDGDDGGHGDRDQDVEQGRLNEVHGVTSASSEGGLVSAQEQEDQGQGQQEDISEQASEQQIGEQQVDKVDNPAVVNRPPPSPQGARGTERVRKKEVNLTSK